MDAKEEIRHLIDARFPLIWVVTQEERRVELALAEICEGQFTLRFWDCSCGFTDIEGEAARGVAEIEEEPTTPLALISAIRSRRNAELWVARDLKSWLHDPVLVRGLKSLARELAESTDFAKSAAVVILSHSAEVPKELQQSTVVVEWPLPTRKEILEVVEEAVEYSEDLGEIEGELEDVIDAAVGLTLADAENAIAISMVHHRKIVPGFVRSYKRKIVEREGLVRWYEPEPRGLEAIGGNDLLKTWLINRRLALTQDARDYGLPAPKGVLLVGPSGCGKSLTAKALPTAWGVPLLQLDTGALRSRYVGDSEANIRRALQLAEAVAPVALWWDEAEKMLAGSQGIQGDSGVSADALGYLLTWLNERAGTVFLVATSNDATRLPPELTRYGRFDGIFFMDLPNKREREEIVSVTIEKSGRSPEAFDLESIAAATPRFSGAELAELFNSALFKAYEDGRREPETEDILEAAKQTRRVADTYPEQIERVREWARERARPASSSEEPESEREDRDKPSKVTRFKSLGKETKLN